MTCFNSHDRLLIVLDCRTDSRPRTQAPDQHLTIRMVAFQNESDLVEMIRPHYKRAEDEGRTLVTNHPAGCGGYRTGEGSLLGAVKPGLDFAGVAGFAKSFAA